MINNSNTEDTIDLKELFFSLLSEWKLIVLCIGISLFMALLYLCITPNTYQAEALLQVQASPQSNMDQNQFTQSQIEILKSNLLTEKVINQLHLDLVIHESPNSVLNRFYHSSQIQYTKNSVIFENSHTSVEIKQFEIPRKFQDIPLNLQIQEQNFTLKDLTTEQILYSGKLNQLQSNNQDWKIAVFAKPSSVKSDLYITKQPLFIAQRQFLENLNVSENGKNTGMIKITYESQTPKNTTNILNSLINNYKIQSFNAVSDQSSQGLTLLNQKLIELQQASSMAEKAFEPFRKNSNSLEFVGQEAYITERVALESKKIDLELQLALDRMIDPLSSNSLATSDALQQQSLELDDINLQILNLENDFLKLYSPLSPDMSAYVDLSIKKQLYHEVFKKYHELSGLKSSTVNTIKSLNIIAEPSKPIKPKKLIVLILSIFVGGFIGVLLALVRTMLRSGIKNTMQIENEIKLPVYAAVPHSSHQNSSHQKNKSPLTKKIAILASEKPQDLAVESIRGVRTILRAKKAESKNNIITILGPTAHVGQTFLAVNLAILLAQTAKKVLLIDADMRNGYLHQYLNQENTNGLAEFLLGKIDLSHLIKTGLESGVAFIACGQYPENPAELLASEKFDILLNELSKQFDYIVIDTPPSLAVTDGILIAQNAGTNLLVARHLNTQMDELHSVLNRFNQANVKINGVVLNNIKNSYGYNYNYAYKARKDQD